MILMLSVHTERGTEATLDALERGAVDFLHKPDGSDSRNIAHLTDEVVAKVDDFAEANVSSVALARATAAAHSTRSGRAGGPGHNTVTGNAVAGGGSDAQLRHDSGTTGPDATPDIGTTSATDEAAEPIAVDGDWADAPTIVLGASTGGPKIVERLFERLPADLEAKVLVVQHMPPTLRPASPSDSTLGRVRRHRSRGSRSARGRRGRGRTGKRPPRGCERHRRPPPSATRRQRAGPRRAAGDRRDDGKRRRTGLRRALWRCSDRDGPRRRGRHRGGQGRGRSNDRSGRGNEPVFGIPCRAIETGCVDAVAPAHGIADAIVDAFTTDGETDD